jgi:hypothetical protein
MNENKYWADKERMFKALELVAKYRECAERARASGKTATARHWEQKARDIESGVEPIYGGE